MRAEEWITQHGSRLRSITAAKLRHALQRVKGECTWCGRLVPKGCRSWCSQECTAAFLERRPADARNIVEMRDRGVCALCKCDTMLLRSFLTKLWYGFNAEYASKERLHWQSVYQFYEAHLHSLGFNSSKGRLFRAPLWEAHHQIPVAEGGGLCGPEGYVSLCVPCHARETREYSRQRAVRRRRKKLE